jgi:hypothetical protein
MRRPQIRDAGATEEAHKSGPRSNHRQSVTENEGYLETRLGHIPLGMSKTGRTTFWHTGHHPILSLPAILPCFVTPHILPWPVSSRYRYSICHFGAYPRARLCGSWRTLSGLKMGSSPWASSELTMCPPSCKSLFSYPPKAVALMSRKVGGLFSRRAQSSVTATNF